MYWLPWIIASGGMLRPFGPSPLRHRRDAVCKSSWDQTPNTNLGGSSWLRLAPSMGWMIWCAFCVCPRTQRWTTKNGPSTLVVAVRAALTHTDRRTTSSNTHVRAHNRRLALPIRAAVAVSAGTPAMCVLVSLSPPPQVDRTATPMVHTLPVRVASQVACEDTRKSGRRAHGPATTLADDPLVSR